MSENPWSTIAHPSFLDVMDAIMLAMQAFTGKVDKTGKPALYHSLRVGASDTLKLPEEMIVGILHDIVEDTGTTMDDIKSRYPALPDVVDAIDAITRRTGEKYFDYIKRVDKNALAARVKIVDLNDNINREHPSVREKESLAKRYKKALEMLNPDRVACEIRFCQRVVRVNELVYVQENLGDESYRVGICQNCATAIGVKEGDDLPPASIVKKALKRKRVA